MFSSCLSNGVTNNFMIDKLLLNQRTTSAFNLSFNIHQCSYLFLYHLVRVDKDNQNKLKQILNNAIHFSTLYNNNIQAST